MTIFTRNDVLDGIKEVLDEIAGVNPDDVEGGSNLADDLEVDSLSMVEVVVALEEKFEVKVPDSAVTGLKTVDQVINFVLAQ